MSIPDVLVSDITHRRVYGFDQLMEHRSCQHWHAVGVGRPFPMYTYWQYTVYILAVDSCVDNVPGCTVSTLGSDYALIIGHWISSTCKAQACKSDTLITFSRIPLSTGVQGTMALNQEPIARARLVFGALLVITCGFAISFGDDSFQMLESFNIWFSSLAFFMVYAWLQYFYLSIN